MLPRGGLRPPQPPESAAGLSPGRALASASVPRRCAASRRSRCVPRRGGACKCLRRFGLRQRRARPPPRFERAAQSAANARGGGRVLRSCWPVPRVGSVALLPSFALLSALSASPTPFPRFPSPAGSGKERPAFGALRRDGRARITASVFSRPSPLPTAPGARRTARAPSPVDNPEKVNLAKT